MRLGRDLGLSFMTEALAVPGTEARAMAALTRFVMPIGDKVRLDFMGHKFVLL